MPRASTNLGTDLERHPSDDETQGAQPFAVEAGPELAAIDGGRSDHFAVRHGRCFAGTHLIIDLWANPLPSPCGHAAPILVQMPRFSSSVSLP